ncbi:unnamed protein product [Angiostrongylus costaricensis]|uniref:PH_RBD domain-containing protein n=1 Tax=Angiostrongylus costaricensis TaxID=334426 RepID=A0A0R3PDQ7_ANGCS|nr:unnamed protein product [Angiostrongylus costaricensis]
MLLSDVPSSRSSPELIANPELRDIDQLSFASQKSAPPPTAEEIRRSEELRRAKAATAHRLQLERVKTVYRRDATGFICGPVHFYELSLKDKETMEEVQKPLHLARTEHLDAKISEWGRVLVVVGKFLSVYIVTTNGDSQLNKE